MRAFYATGVPLSRASSPRAGSPQRVRPEPAQLETGRPCAAVFSCAHGDNAMATRFAAPSVLLLSLAACGSYTWTSSDSSIVTAEPGVLTPGSGLGQAIVTARSASGQTAAARVWVQRPESVPSTYRISLHFGADVPAAWRPLFEDAARQWERVIRAELPAATIDGDLEGVCGTSRPRKPGIMRHHDALPSPHAPDFNAPLRRCTRSSSWGAAGGHVHDGTGQELPVPE